MKCPECKGTKQTLTPRNGWVRCERCNATGEVIDAARVAFDALLVAAEEYLAAVDAGGKLAALGVNKKVKAARDALRKAVNDAKLANVS